MNVFMCHPHFALACGMWAYNFLTFFFASSFFCSHKYQAKLCALFHYEKTNLKMNATNHTSSTGACVLLKHPAPCMEYINLLAEHLIFLMPHMLALMLNINLLAALAAFLKIFA